MLPEKWFGYHYHFVDFFVVLNLVQVPLFNILKKFDGETVTEVVRPKIARMRYRVVKLPQYLILHMLRFTKNNFFVEKNPTLGKDIWTGYSHLMEMSPKKKCYHNNIQVFVMLESTFLMILGLLFPCLKYTCGFLYIMGLCLS